jgi:hypothetical protein
MIGSGQFESGVQVHPMTWLASRQVGLRVSKSASHLCAAGATSVFIYALIACGIWAYG